MSATLSNHLIVDCADAVKGALDGNINALFPLVQPLFMLSKKTERHCSGVIYQHIHASIGLNCKSDHVKHIFPHSHISDYIAGFSALGLDFFNCCLELFLTPRRQNSLAAELRDTLCRQKTEAVGCAGNDDNFVSDIVFFRFHKFSSCFDIWISRLLNPLQAF